MTKYLEKIKPLPAVKNNIRVVLFDFDGTISTLRQGWEKIMEPLMIEMITGNSSPDQELIEEIRDFIDESTGVQTIHQMFWLENKVKEYGKNPLIKDAWWYKEEYNQRLLKKVKTRTDKLISGELSPKDYRIKGSYEFMEDLYHKGIDIYIASGTDDVDVQREVQSIGVKQFVKHVAGAPHLKVDCSKEAVIKSLLEDKGLKGNELLLIGDGKVEISLGVDAGAISLGAATDEIKRYGVNDVKRTKLIKAGAHAIVGDFTQYTDIYEWLGL